MKANEVIVVHPKNLAQLEALKTFMEAFKIDFKVHDEQDYHPAFINKIKASRKQAKNGEVTRVKKEQLKSFLGV
jgi:hypothetical protein